VNAFLPMPVTSFSSKSINKNKGSIIVELHQSLSACKSKVIELGALLVLQTRELSIESTALCSPLEHAHL